MSAASDNFNVALSSLNAAVSNVTGAADAHIAKSAAALASGISVADPAFQTAADQLNSLATVLQQTAAKLQV